MALPSSRRGVHPSQVDNDGFINFDGAPNATKTKKGFVSIGTGIQVSNGKISVDALPDHQVSDAGKVLTVADDGSVIWAQGGGGGTKLITEEDMVESSVCCFSRRFMNKTSLPFGGTQLEYYYDLGEKYADLDTIDVIILIDNPSSSNYINVAQTDNVAVEGDVPATDVTLNWSSASYAWHSDIIHRYVYVGVYDTVTGGPASFNVKLYINK